MASRDIRPARRIAWRVIGQRWGVAAGQSRPPRVKNPSARAVAARMATGCARSRRRVARQADHRRGIPKHRQRRAGGGSRRPRSRHRGPARRGEPVGLRARVARRLADDSTHRTAAGCDVAERKAIDHFFELAHTDGSLPIVRATRVFKRAPAAESRAVQAPPARRILSADDGVDDSAYGDSSASRATNRPGLLLWPPFLQCGGDRLSVSCRSAGAASPRVACHRRAPCPPPPFLPPTVRRRRERASSGVPSVSALMPGPPASPTLVARASGAVWLRATLRFASARVRRPCLSLTRNAWLDAAARRRRRARRSPTEKGPPSTCLPDADPRRHRA